jgi:hypothetical protein
MICSTLDGLIVDLVEGAEVSSLGDNQNSCSPRILTLSTQQRRRLLCTRNVARLGTFLETVDAQFIQSTPIQTTQGLRCTTLAGRKSDFLSVIAAQSASDLSRISSFPHTRFILITTSLTIRDSPFTTSRKTTRIWARDGFGTHIFPAKPRSSSVCAIISEPFRAGFRSHPRCNTDLPYTFQVWFDLRGLKFVALA